MKKISNLLLKKKLQLRYTNSDIQNLKMLLNKRIDLTIMNKTVGEFLIRKNLKDDASKIYMGDKVIYQDEAFILFPKEKERSKELIEQFEKGLLILKRNGTFQRLNSRLKSGYYDN